jgi:hypothetical protein
VERRKQNKNQKQHIDFSALSVVRGKRENLELLFSSPFLCLKRRQDFAFGLEIN